MSWRVRVHLDPVVRIHGHENLDRTVPVHVTNARRADRAVRLALREALGGVRKVPRVGAGCLEYVDEAGVVSGEENQRLPFPCVRRPRVERARRPGRSFARPLLRGNVTRRQHVFRPVPLLEVTRDLERKERTFAVVAVARHEQLVANYVGFDSLISKTFLSSDFSGL